MVMMRSQWQWKGFVMIKRYTLETHCSAKKNIYVIGGSKRELGSAWTRSECTYQVDLPDFPSNLLGFCIE